MFMKSNSTKKLFGRLLAACGMWPCLIALILALGTHQPAQAQQKVTVTGRVIDEAGDPVIGATVVVKGANIGASTDVKGNYTLAALPSQTLEFSFIGMNKVTEEVGSRTRIDVTLRTDALAIDPVVAIGYGTMRRSDLTGAVASVSSDAIAKSGAVSLDQALQGRAAGVQMTTNTGMPGGGTSIQVRGSGSVNSSTGPLYIIDGVTIDSHTGTYTDNAISSINPADIESIDILKDASALAIYGAQGANGVILITTKSGKAGQTRVTFDAQYSVQSIAKYLDMADLQEYAYHHNTLYDMKGWGRTDAFADPSLLTSGTNWQKEIFRPAAMQNYSISASGGSNTTTFKISGNYLDQDGVAVGSGFKRFTGNAVVDTEVKKWLKLGGMLNLSVTEQTITVADWDLINKAVRQVPYMPARNLDGTYGGSSDRNDAVANPLALAQLIDQGTKNTGTRTNVYAEIKPAKWMTFRTEYSASLGHNETYAFVPTYQLGWMTNSPSTNTKTQSSNAFWAFRNVLTLRHTFAEKHSVTLMGGQEITKNSNNYLMGKRLSTPDTLRDLDAGDALSATNGGNTYEQKFSSFFARLNYSYDGRYLLTGTIRRDGTSNFARGSRWGTFPSVSGAWVISKEKFMQEVDWVNNMKIRAGYGEVGNSNVTRWAYVALMSNIPTIWGTGYGISNIPNDKLKWESTSSYNLGLDLGFFKNRIEVIADVYKKRTDDLLLLMSPADYAGTGGIGKTTLAPWANIGSLENRGFELTINTVNIDRKNFRWRSNFVFSTNKNEILKLDTENAYIDRTYDLSGQQYIISRTKVGGSLGEFFGYKVAGRINSANDLYDSDGNVKVAIPRKGTTTDPIDIKRNGGLWVGDFLWEDTDHNGEITEADQVSLGSPLPKFTGGLGNTFSWKGLDLNIYLTFSYGNKVLNFLSTTIYNPNTREGITSRAASNYAKLSLIDPNGSEDDIWNVYVSSAHPKMYRMASDDVNKNSRISSNMIEDGSYLRISNISLTYNLPSKWTSKMGLNQVKVYTNIQNLWTFTKYSGYDPEVGMMRSQYMNYGQDPLMNGVDVGRYPSPRTFMFGLTIGF